jgi:hypothetical protein
MPRRTSVSIAAAAALLVCALVLAPVYRAAGAPTINRWAGYS